MICRDCRVTAPSPGRCCFGRHPRPCYSAAGFPVSTIATDDDRRPPEVTDQIADFLRAHGVRHIVVDSDGNNDVVIPLWLEIGVNGLRPFEIAAGCDPVVCRKTSRKDLVMQGGIDKRELAEGPEAIDREVLPKVPWLCMQGDPTF